jgi:predicted secreted protein
MSWITGSMLYGVIWWTGLFAVLPFFSRPVAAPDPHTGWRGTPDRLRIGRIVLANTVVAALLWGLAYLAITSDWLSFRHGFLAIQS